MANVKESQLIEKLNQGNYSNWKFRIEMMLIKEDLFETITDNPPDPLTADWQKKDRKARALINLFIEDSQIVHVKQFLTARETWNGLKAIHERTNLSSKLYLLRKLYSIKLSENGNMQTHITKILETVDKLKGIGEEINNSHISALFLCSLPPSYETLITALEARPEEELNPEFISGKLIDEYNRRRDNQETPQGTSKAFQANKKFPNNNSYKRENKYCSYCKMKNHYKSECWHLKNKTNYSAGNKNYKHKFKNNSSQLVYETNNEPPARNRTQNNRTGSLDQLESKMNNIAFITSETKNNNWIIDSGSSSHITNNENLFTKITDRNKSEVIVANGNILTAFGSGEIKIEHSNREIKYITLKDVLYVPELKANLFSVKKATQNGCKVIFTRNNCKVIYNDKLILEGEMKNNLYEIEFPMSEDKNHIYMVNRCNNPNCIQLWHRRMGHKNFDSIKEIKSKQLAEGIKVNECKHDTVCETCIKSKLTDTPYPKATENRGTRILQLVHSDICGPFSVPTIGGKTYLLTFIDDYSRYTMIYLLSKKSEVISKFKEYVAFTKNKFGKMPETLRSDNGGEYTSNELEDYLRYNGINHQLSVPHCPSQNGTAERKNRTLVEMTRTMLSEANLDKKFWGEAINTANYLQNILPTKANTKTPFELWNGRKPNLRHLRVFGCKAYAYIHKSKRGKLDDRAQEGIFVGYDNNAKAYRIYIEGKCVTIARTVKFLEDSMHTKQLSTENNPDTQIEEKTEVEVELDTPQDNEQSISDHTTLDQPRRSERSNKGVPPDRLIYLAQQNKIEEPKEYNEILKINVPREKQNWLNAMKEEMDSLIENNTFTLVDPPQGRKVIGSKWTYKVKYNSKGEIVKYKARLVAKGYTQKYGEDYYETFAPVVSHTTIRALLVGAAHRKNQIKHIDVKTAFLHGDLDEVVYMQQPDGYIPVGKENKVWKLNKAIYGLKQAARAWHLKIGESLKKLKFEQSSADPCLFKKGKAEETVYIIVYVDDILISGSEEQIKKIMNELSQEYDLTDLGEINYYLGINIQKDNQGNYQLNQRHKIEELVNKYNLQDSKPYSTPMDAGYLRNDGDENELPNNIKYRQAIGSLLYIATVTRPDITAATNILSRRNEKPRQMDWNAVKRLITYLNHTKNLNLVIKSTAQPILTTYADADWAGDKSDRKSTSGNIFMINDSPIHWLSKKQTSVALSSAEAEYISVANATQEIQWLIKLLKDLDMPQTLPVTVYEDNQSCIKMINSPKYISRTKHIDIKYHAIRHLKETGIIELSYMSTKTMIADIMTKPLPKPEYLKLRAKLLQPPEGLSGD